MSINVKDYLIGPDVVYENGKSAIEPNPSLGRGRLKDRVRKSVLAKFNPNHDELGRFASAPGRAPTPVNFHHDKKAVSGTFYFGNKPYRDTEISSLTNYVGSGWEFTSNRDSAVGWAQWGPKEEGRTAHRTNGPIQISKLKLFENYDDKRAWEGQALKDAGYAVEWIPTGDDKGFYVPDWVALEERAITEFGVEKSQAMATVQRWISNTVRDKLEDEGLIGIATTVPAGWTNVWIPDYLLTRYGRDAFTDPKTGKVIDPYGLMDKAPKVEAREPTGDERFTSDTGLPSDPAKLKRLLVDMAVFTGLPRKYAEQKVVLGGEGFDFEIGGRKCKAAGSFSPQTGDVTIYRNPGTKHTRAETTGIMAHEVAHVIWQHVKTISEAEAQNAYRNDHTRASGEVITTRYEQTRDPDGLMTTHMDRPYPTGYEKLYPVYHEMRELFEASSKLVAELSKHDGVSQYSADYWREYENTKQTHDLFSAINETFAEMARIELQEKYKIKLGVSDKKPHPLWTKWWKKLKRTWNKHLVETIA